MTLVALGSVKGAPGVSTLALALASVWPADRCVTLVEADPDGGVLAARRGLRVEPGLVTLAAAVRRGADGFGGHAQELGAGVRAVVAPPAAEQVRAALSVAGDLLPTALAADDEDVLIDCGRLHVASPAMPLCRHADATLLALRPRLDDVMVVRTRVVGLRQIGVDPALLLLRDGPYPADEVAAAVDATVAAEIPADHRAAAALDDPAGGAVPSRSPLLRSARRLAHHLAMHTVADVHR